MLVRLFFDVFMKGDNFGFNISGFGINLEVFDNFYDIVVNEVILSGIDDDMGVIGDFIQSLLEGSFIEEGYVIG